MAKRKRKEQTENAIGYSYIRFSSDKQKHGDSQRRQTEATSQWCERNGVVLDTTSNMKELGRSAFRGKHRDDKSCLGAFLKLADDGRIPKGSYLIIENLDRLSREDERTALRLWMDILDRGINVVQLWPETIFRHDDTDMVDIMRAIIELSRGHSESRAKSERLSQVWTHRRKQTQDNGTILTKRVPGWIEVRGEYLYLNPNRAEIVREIFRWCIEGRGLSLIVKELEQRKIKPWGRAKNWSKAYVQKILTGRIVLGELEMNHGKENVPDYFPKVIDEQTWERAQHALQSRKDKPGRKGDKITSLFTGLLMDGETQSNMQVANQTRGLKGNRQRKKVLCSALSMEGSAKSESFPYDVFEDAILSRLKEINPADVLGDEPQGESVQLAEQLAITEHRISQLEDELIEGDVPAISRTIKKLDTERRELVKKLANARQRESSPLSATWGEMKSLLDVSDSKDNRLRLRGLLQHAIEGIHLVIIPRTPRPSHRIAVVQIHFAGGGRRDYVIWYWSAGRGREGGYRCRSMRDPIKLIGYDLRDRKSACQCKKHLQDNAESILSVLGWKNLTRPEENPL